MRSRIISASRHRGGGLRRRGGGGGGRGRFDGLRLLGRGVAEVLYDEDLYERVKVGRGGDYAVLGLAGGLGLYARDRADDEAGGDEAAEPEVRISSSRKSCAPSVSQVTLTRPSPMSA